MAHDNSLPTGDLAEPEDAPEQPSDRRPAIVIQLPGGGYFRAFSPRSGRVVAKRVAARAKIFHPESRKAIDQTLAKLRRKDVAAVAIKVTIVVG